MTREASSTHSGQEDGTGRESARSKALSLKMAVFAAATLTQLSVAVFLGYRITPNMDTLVPWNNRILQNDHSGLDAGADPEVPGSSSNHGAFATSIPNGREQLHRTPSPVIDLHRDNLVMFGAGPGTTATHSMYRSTCRLGIPSIHFIRICHKQHFNASVSAMQTDEATLRTVESHLRSRKINHQMCLYNDPKCRTPKNDVEKVLNRFRQDLTEIVKLNPVLALHDTPYPKFPDLVEEVVTQIHGRPPLVLLSQRDPFKWSRRRMERHPEPLCRDNYDPVDYFGCIKRALQHRNQRRRQQFLDNNNDRSSFSSQSVSNSTAQQPLYFCDVFVKFEDMLPPEADNSPFVLDSDGVKHNRSAVFDGVMNGMQRHMDRYSRKALYAIDVFDSKEKVSSKKIASDIGLAFARIVNGSDSSWKFGPTLKDESMFDYIRADKPRNS